MGNKVSDKRSARAAGLDKICVVVGALLPLGIVIGNAGLETVLGVVGLVWIIRCVVARENPLPVLLRHPLVLPWLAWYAVIVASLLWNGAGSKGWAHDVLFFRQPLFVMAMLDVSRRRAVLRPFLLGLAGALLWAAANTAAAYLLGHDFLGRSLYRYMDKVKEPARMAALAAYGSPLFLGWALADGRGSRWRVVLIALAGLAFTLVALSFVRTAALAALAGIGLAVFLVLRKNYLLLGAILLVSLVLSAGFLHRYPLKYQAMVNMYARVYIWQVSGRIWREHPLLGVGVSSYVEAFSDVVATGKVPAMTAPGDFAIPRDEYTHAHNQAMMILACSGLLGLVAFGWLFVNLIRATIRVPPPLRTGLVTVPLVLLVIGLTGWNIYYSYYQALLAFLVTLAGVAAGVKESGEGEG